MFTVGQVAKAIGISDSAVRQWADEYTAHLSDSANPPKGETRRFDEEDIAVLQTVAVLREQIVPHEQIHSRLDEGERLEPAPGERPAVDDEDETPDRAAGDSDTALVTEQFAEALRRQDSRLQALTDRLIEAEKRASAAETRADMLQAQVDELRAAEGEEEGRPPWWAFWR